MHNMIKDDSCVGHQPRSRRNIWKHYGQLLQTKLVNTKNFLTLFVTFFHQSEIIVMYDTFSRIEVIRVVVVVSSSLRWGPAICCRLGRLYDGRNAYKKSWKNWFLKNANGMLPVTIASVSRLGFYNLLDRERASLKMNV